MSTPANPQPAPRQPGGPIGRRFWDRLRFRSPRRALGGLVLALLLAVIAAAAGLMIALLNRPLRAILRE